MSNVDNLVLGKVVTSDVGQWKVQARDPVFLMPLLLHVFAELLFRLVIFMMSMSLSLFTFRRSSAFFP